MLAAESPTMREYVFLLEYDRGIHPVRDVFIDHPEVVVTALDISLARDRGWRVERMTGPEEALDAVEAVYFDAPPPIRSERDVECCHHDFGMVDEHIPNRVDTTIVFEQEDVFAHYRILSGEQY